MNYIYSSGAKGVSPIAIIGSAQRSTDCQIPFSQISSSPRERCS